MNEILLKAYAKINIGLEILFKRPDGYHEINTIFSRIPLFDEIIINKNSKLIIDCIPSLEIPQEKNIAYKSAKLIQEYNNCINYGAKILIKKHIPDGAGLGGGSSDAAKVLLGLVKFWNLKLNYKELYNIACKLGSDVPYFLNEGTASASSRGEILDYFDYEIPYSILLIFPDFKISTKWAYEELNIGEKIKSPSDFKNLLIKSKKDSSILKKYFVNDFEELVFKFYPDLADIKQALYKNGAVYSQLSGSGSTIFGFFESKEIAIKAQKQFLTMRTMIC